MLDDTSHGGTTSRFQILSLDGGGLKGLFSAALLAEFEADLGVSIVDHFDLIVGTSTGGLVALGLGAGFAPHQIVEFYVSEGPQIFGRAKGRVRTARRAKYSPDRLESALKELFEDRTLGSSQRPLVIPSYSLDAQDVYIFKTPHHPHLTRDWRELMADVALATTAAPTFLPAHALRNLRLIDGGVWANNPTLVGVVEAVSTFNTALAGIRVLSLGTTDAVSHLGSGLTDGGWLQWGLHGAPAILRAQNLGTFHAAEHLIGKHNVERVNAPVPDGLFNLDRIDVRGIRALAEDVSRRSAPQVAAFAAHRPPPYTPALPDEGQLIMQHAEYFKKFLVDEVNLNQTRLDKLDSRVESVYKALRDDAEIGGLILGMHKQGSWPHRLIIRPATGGDFDADFLLEIAYQADWRPSRYINEVYNALDRHSTYTKQKHGRKCRCVWLEYAEENGIGCHLDIVPFITLPDGRRVIVNRDNDTWEPQYGSTDPQGFTAWVKRRDELTGNQFRRVVRLMKYLKRERGSFKGVKSVILTTLLGEQLTELDALNPSRFSNLPTALIHIVEALDSWLQAQPMSSKPPSLANPNGDGTTFDHRWNLSTYLNFRDRVHSIAADMRSAYDEPDAQKSSDAWQKLFGDNFTPPKATTSSTNPYKVAAAGASTAAASSRSGRSG